MKCESCKYWNRYPEAANVGDCHRYPPQLFSLVGVKGLTMPALRDYNRAMFTDDMAENAKNDFGISAENTRWLAVAPLPPNSRFGVNTEAGDSLEIRNTEHRRAPLPGCRQSAGAPKGLGTDGYKPLMQNHSELSSSATAILPGNLLCEHGRQPEIGDNLTVLVSSARSILKRQGRGVITSLGGALQAALGAHDTRTIHEVLLTAHVTTRPVIAKVHGAGRVNFDSKKTKKSPAGCDKSEMSREGQTEAGNVSAQADAQPNRNIGQAEPTKETDCSGVAPGSHTHDRKRNRKPRIGILSVFAPGLMGRRKSRSGDRRATPHFFGTVTTVETPIWWTRWLMHACHTQTCRAESSVLSRQRRLPPS